MENIRARAHFVVVFTPTALDRLNEPDDWMRRELQTALAGQRNVVPVLMDGFSMRSPVARERLTGELSAVRNYQAHEIPASMMYFDHAMTLLRQRFLAVPVDAVTHPASAHARDVARAQQAAAIQATPVTDVKRAPEPLPPPANGQRLVSSQRKHDSNQRMIYKPSKTEERAWHAESAKFLALIWLGVFAVVAILVAVHRWRTPPIDAPVAVPATVPSVADAPSASSLARQPQQSNAAEALASPAASARVAVPKEAIKKRAPHPEKGKPPSPYGSSASDGQH